MIMGPRLRELRESKNLRHGDIERITGLRRAYTSRVECGRTIPSIQNLEKYAMAFGIPLYRLFYDGENPEPLKLSSSDDPGWGSTPKEAADLQTFTKSFARMSKRNRALLLRLAQRIVVTRLLDKKPKK